MAYLCENCSKHEDDPGTQALVLGLPPRRPYNTKRVEEPMGGLLNCCSRCHAMCASCKGPAKRTSTQTNDVQHPFPNMHLLSGVVQFCDRDGFPFFAWITPPSPLPEPALTSVLKPKSCAELSFGRMPSFQLTPAGPPCSSKTRIFTLLKSFRHADRPARPARASQPHVQTDAARIRQRSDSQRHLAPLCVALCDR